ncbi:hypothetical protein DPMN_174949 [Dreissena polymorpha]|uniref:Uncharacterized protein n=1 Tax=Dreissena polymorpha TaxID=45954 RepID=A0A9D4IIA3_DREPO|nr:hypothetical protein DPMN_174949 [Dreissena polymorpha]
MNKSSSPEGGSNSPASSSTRLLGSACSMRIVFVTLTYPIKTDVAIISRQPL